MYILWLQDVLIKCKRKNLNHERNQKYGQFKEIPLASKGWRDKKAKDDYFTIHIYNNASCIFTILIYISCFKLYYFNGVQDYLPQSRKPLYAFESTGLSQPILDILKQHKIIVPSQIQVKIKNVSKHCEDI